MLFDNRQESNLRSCAQMIEDVIASLGHDLRQSRLEVGAYGAGASARPGGGPMLAWHLRKGETNVYVLIVEHHEANYVVVSAPILHLEDGCDEGGLLRMLLELNVAELVGVAFGLKPTPSGTDVVLVAERPTVGLDRDDVVEVVSAMTRYADHYRRDLVEEFGGRVAGLSAAPIKRP